MLDAANRSARAAAVATTVALAAASLAAIPALAQPADQKAIDSPSVETAVPSAQTSGLTVSPTAEDNWDRNDDGRLDRGEFTAYFGEASVFRRFDDDGSGLIEPDEFERKMFRMIDGDANAELDDMEWRAAERWYAITPYGAFENFDDNNDGIIERAEFRAMPRNREVFAEWDIDDDGEVTPDELRAGLYESVNFNERNPLAALLDESVGDDEVGNMGRDTGPISAGEDKTGDAQPNGGGGQTAKDGGAADAMSGASDARPVCAEKVARLDARAEDFMAQPANTVPDARVAKVRNLMRRANAFCEEGEDKKAAELTDNVRELLEMK